MNVRIELAKATDDAALRRLLAANAVPGRITITYEREPNYFLGCNTMGARYQVLVARHSEADVIAVACRTQRSLFVNGVATNIGYLGQLRVDERFRGRWLVSQGFQALRQLHDADPAPAYLLSVIEQNREAFGVLIERRRKHFPSFFALGRLFTLALPVHRPKPTTTTLELAHGSLETLPEISAFLQQHGRTRQFFPAYTLDDFSDGETTRDFQPEDFVLAYRNGQLAGIIGLWDQARYKQTVVRGYAGWLRTMRPFYNAVAKLSGRPLLPALGQEIRYAYASFVCVADDDAEVFDTLLRQTLALAAARGQSYLMIGLTECDPLLPIAQRHPHIAYPSRVFLAAWENGKEFYERLDGRAPYLEIATL